MSQTSDVTVKAETAEPKTSGLELSNTGRSSMQGISEAPTAPPASEITAPAVEAGAPGNCLNASQFSPETQQALLSRGLDDSEVIMKDWRKAEQAAGIVLKHEGLPDSSGSRRSFKEVVGGNYDNLHGIDLVGVDETGKPYPIEVKKRSDPQNDVLNEHVIDEKDLLPETLALKADILRERAVNPPMHDQKTDLAPGTPDHELSTQQMGDLWLRDRWLRLVKDPEKREMLSEAGVGSKYLDYEKLSTSAYAPEWLDLLRNRATVFVTSEKEDVSDPLWNEAVFERGFDVASINMRA